MGNKIKRIKLYNNSEELEQSLLNCPNPSVLWSKDNSSDYLIGQITSLEMMLNMGMLSASTNGSIVTIVPMASTIPYLVKHIKNFEKVMVNQEKIEGYENYDYTIFKLGSNYPSSYPNDVLEVFNGKTIKKTNLSPFKFQGYNCPDVDFVLNFESDWDYQTWDEAFINTRLKSLTLNLLGKARLTSMHRLARQLKCDKITINGKCGPNDMSGAFEQCSMYEMPNTIDYSHVTNFGWAFEACWNLREIPSYYTVTDEESRLNTPENIIGGSVGGVTTLVQSFNQIYNCTKIGPVIDAQRNYDTYLTFNYCPKLTDVRLKNLNNVDYNFTNQLSNMDMTSIKYCIENLTDLYNYNWPKKEFTIPESTGYPYLDCIIESENRVMYKDLFTLNGEFALKIPQGYIARLIYIKGSKWMYNQTSEYVGTGELVSGLTVLDSSYPQVYFELRKEDGSNVSLDDFDNDNIQLLTYSYSAVTDESGNTTNEIVWSKNKFRQLHHTVSFSKVHETELKDKTIITNDILLNAKEKGWTIKVGDEILNTES